MILDSEFSGTDIIDEITKDYIEDAFDGKADTDFTNALRDSIAYGAMHILNTLIYGRAVREGNSEEVIDKKYYTPQKLLRQAEGALGFTDEDCDCPDCPDCGCHEPNELKVVH